MITLEPYNIHWRNDFTRAKNKLLNALSDIIEEIEHIGSTAISGIYAKPVIDMMVGVKNLEHFTKEHSDKIESLGYEYIKLYEENIPNRRFFQKNDSQGNRTHQIHLVNRHSAWWQRHILFRDYLNNHQDMAKEYESLKFKLANSLNELQSENADQENFFTRHFQSHPEIAAEFQRMKNRFGSKFTITNQYALAKSPFIQMINEQAYFDFDTHKVNIILNRLNGYIPQLACTEVYKNMFQDSDFVHCYGLRLSDERINKILERDTNNWDKYGFGPYVWFNKKNQHFVGEGGLNHTNVDNKNEIELTYSLDKNYWGEEIDVEIGQFAIDHAFNNLNLDNMVCFTMTSNNRSLQVIKKLGFEYEKNFMHHNLPHKLFRLKQHKVELHDKA